MCARRRGFQPTKHQPRQGTCADLTSLVIWLPQVLALANTGDLIFYGEPGHWNEVAMLLRYSGKDNKPDELILFELRGVNYAGDRLK